MSCGIFFDLDGTLADTAPDLALAINLVLQKAGQPALRYKAIRPFVSGGSPALIKLAFNLTPENPEFEQLKIDFLNFYEQNIHKKSQLFSGVKSCLNYLNTHSIPWGIVTNKPDYLTQILITKIPELAQAKVIISGDTYPEKKPHPYPLLQACQLTNTIPENSFYIGDDERDIIAARKSGMKSVCAEWGYLSEQNPKKWDADYYLQTSDELEVFIKYHFPH